MSVFNKAVTDFWSGANRWGAIQVKNAAIEPYDVAVERLFAVTKPVVPFVGPDMVTNRSGADGYRDHLQDVMSVQFPAGDCPRTHIAPPARPVSTRRAYSIGAIPLPSRREDPRWPTTASGCHSACVTISPSPGSGVARGLAAFLDALRFDSPTNNEFSRPPRRRRRPRRSSSTCVLGVDGSLAIGSIACRCPERAIGHEHNRVVAAARGELWLGWVSPPTLLKLRRRSHRGAQASGVRSGGQNS